MCLHIPASLGCITPRLLHHPASLPGVLWARPWRGLLGIELSVKGWPQRQPAALSPVLSAGSLVPRVAPASFQASLSSPRPCLLAPSGTCYPEAAGENLTRRRTPKGGTRDCLYEPCGFFVFLPKEVSNCRDCSIYSPSSFTLKKKKISFPR